MCYSVEMKEKRLTGKLDSFAERATAHIGSAPSLVVHTIVFIMVLSLPFFGVNLETALLLLTTAVSLEAIYLALFIQMSINRNTAQLEAVEEDLEEIQEEVGEIGEDVEEMQKDVDEISEDIEEIQEDVEEMSEDVEGIEKSVDAIKEDVAELEENVDEETERDHKVDSEQKIRIGKIENMLIELAKELRQVKK